MVADSELQNHLDNEGRLVSWPSKRPLQLLALDYLAEKLEPQRIYTEKEINALLNSWHTFGDPALLRRELYERGLLNRQKNGAEYWRTPNTKFHRIGSQNFVALFFLVVTGNR